MILGGRVVSVLLCTQLTMNNRILSLTVNLVLFIYPAKFLKT